VVARMAGERSGFMRGTKNGTDSASGSDIDMSETNTIFPKRKQPLGPSGRFLFCFEGSHGPTHLTPTFENGEFAADWEA